MGEGRGSWLLVIAVLVGLALSPTSALAETNADTAVPPVCSTAQDVATWEGASNQALKNSFLGDKDAAPLTWVGVGAVKYSCAAQLHEVLSICDGTVVPCTRQPIGFETHAHGSAFPDTIDAAGGDGQNVHIAIPDAVSDSFTAAADWGQCLPARTYYPGFCNVSEFNQGTPNGYPSAGGGLLYRFRDNTGNFSGPWYASDGRYSPGFVFKRPANLAPCTAAMNTCDYEVDFIRTTAGKPVNTADAQVLLPVNATVPNPAWAGAPPGTLYSQLIAIPMLIVQSGGTAPPTTNGGGSPGSNTIPVSGSTPTSSAGPGSGGTTPAWPRGKRTLKPLRAGGATVPASLTCAGKNCAVTLTAPKGAKGAKVTLKRGSKIVASANARFAKTTKATKRTVKLSSAAAASGVYTLQLAVFGPAGRSVRMKLSFSVH